MENKETRTVKRSVSMDIKAHKDATARRINVIFDMSKLTDEQIADWAVSANGIRVWFQNRERPKGDEHLIALSKKTDLVVEVPSCGTRVASVREPNDDDIAKFLAKKFGDKSPEEVAAALRAMQNGSGIEI